MSQTYTLTLPTSWGQEQRMRLHAIFNQWMATCSEEDFQRLMRLREQVAPGQVCSIVKLVRSCFARTDLQDALPASLLQLMQVRNWPRASFAAPVRAA